MMRRGLWERFALIIVLLTVGGVLLTPLFIPLLDQYFIKVEHPDAIVVKGYVGQHGGYEPKIIRVKVNETVRIAFYAMDIPQSLSIDALNLDTGVVVPEVTEEKVIEVKFTNPGIYVFRNTVPNGPMSPFQIGYIVVEGDQK
jgi:heme/copper-type cytochrome/quinol oxidase subunit 2